MKEKIEVFSLDMRSIFLAEIENAKIDSTVFGVTKIYKVVGSNSNNLSLIFQFPSDKFVLQKTSL